MYKIFIYTSEEGKISIVGRFQDYELKDNNIYLIKGILDESLTLKQYNRKISIVIPKDTGRTEYQGISFDEPIKTTIINKLELSIEDIETYEFQESVELFIEVFDNNAEDFKEFVAPAEATDLY